MSHGPRIYNLFPLLAGRLPRWRAHLERAAAMGFTWVFVNACHQAGYSGSLDSVKDHDAVDARLVEGSAPPAEQLADMLREVSALGLSVMMDLVIKHTAFDWPMIQEHIDGSGGTSRARSFAPEPRMGSGGSCGGVRPRWTTPAAPTRALCGPPDGDSPPPLRRRRNPLGSRGPSDRLRGETRRSGNRYPRRTSRDGAVAPERPPIGLTGANNGRRKWPWPGNEASW